MVRKSSCSAASQCPCFSRLNSLDRARDKFLIDVRLSPKYRVYLKCTLLEKLNKWLFLKFQEIKLYILSSFEVALVCITFQLVFKFSRGFCPPALHCVNDQNGKNLIIKSNITPVSTSTFFKKFVFISSRDVTKMESLSYDSNLAFMC